MTKWILRLTLLLIPTLLFAQTAVQKDAALAYEKGDFTKSAELYQSLADENYQSADLYLNLGNAYYKSGNVAKA
ncbi:MAG: tetratricopeptide repeat protein, partial [Bacteroidales bacterium]